MIATATLVRHIERGLRLSWKAVSEFDPVKQRSPKDCYEPLIQRFLQERRSGREGVVLAFCSISPGEGVTYVTAKVACELSQRSGENVLLTTASSLSGAIPALSPDVSMKSAKVWRLAPANENPKAPLPALHPDGLQGLRKHFPYVLVDCPSLKRSCAVVSVARFALGIILVVAAGEARRDEIERVQSLLEQASCNILGVVLNKRTDPVPQCVAQYL